MPDTAYFLHLEIPGLPACYPLSTHLFIYRMTIRVNFQFLITVDRKDGVLKKEGWGIKPKSFKKQRIKYFKLEQTTETI